MHVKKYITDRFSSFLNAVQGLRLACYQANIKVLLFITIVLIVVGITTRFSKQEWINTIICIGFVISLEVVNTSLEYICDFIHPAHHGEIKKIKDLAAAAVLIAATAVLIVMTIIITI